MSYPRWAAVVSRRAAAMREVVRHLREQCSIVLREVRAQSRGYGERVTLARNLSSGERLSVDLPITHHCDCGKHFGRFIQPPTQNRGL